MQTEIFKAYDIRGVWPNEINAQDGYKIAQAYAEVIKPKAAVVVGYDVRIHSRKLAEKVIEGLTDAGVDVISIGLVSTEMMYFAVGSLKAGGGIQVTASHNPSEWHGMKMVRAQAAPISGESGLAEIKAAALAKNVAPSAPPGTATQRDVLNDYIDFVINWIDRAAIKPLTLVYNPNFGLEGKLLEALVARTKLPLTIIPLNAEPDGTFPKGRPDPFVPENRSEFVALVKSTGADLGVAWDADADRVFFCADDGTFLEPYYTNLLLIEQILKKNPGENIIYDPRTVWATLDVIKQFGGKPVPSRVGHSFIKTVMREHNAAFSGEASGHTYFRDFWYADTGIIPLLLILELVSKSDKKLGELVRPYLEKYPISGEINSTVSDTNTILKKLETNYNDAKLDHFDGLTIEYDDLPRQNRRGWRANIRSSNTEPLLRLNLEAKTKELVEQKRNELLSIIRA
ncbi:phosphomannomutase/phosphoglucomutase [Candidatus Berkelbacteria bacterium]|nr:phosphomannomutase/phosphoglucomutase [Candidatus Berkelbacteria bacterium]